MATLSPRVRSLEIIPNFYQLSIRAVNIFLIIEEKITLIDTGFRGGSPKIVDFLHKIGRSVEDIGLIIITHNHVDHIGGLTELRPLTKAKVAIHRAGIINEEDEPPYPGGVRRLLSIPFLSTLRGHFMLKPEDVDIKLDDGMMLAPLGGLQVVHTPGHTPGSICLYSPQNKMMLVGDALVKSLNNPNLPHRMVAMNFKEAVESVKKIAALDIDILCFGHGKPLYENVNAKLLKLVEKIGGYTS